MTIGKNLTDEIEDVESDNFEGLDDMFEEPEGFRPPPPQPTTHTITRKNGHKLNIELIGHHSLWSHCLWNAGVFLAHYIDKNPSTVENKNILELGSAATLPSFVCLLNGAKFVVASDYPERPIIDMIKRNAERNLSKLDLNTRFAIEGYLWGSPASVLTRHLPNNDTTTTTTTNNNNSSSSSNAIVDSNKDYFDIIIMSDLICNHNEHRNLLKTAKECLNPLNTSAFVWVTFSHHRPKLIEKDLKFLEIAKEEGFIVELVDDTIRMDVMFENDPGDVSIRQTVHFYKLYLSTYILDN